MINKFLATFLSFVLIFLLAACSQSAVRADAPVPTESEITLAQPTITQPALVQATATAEPAPVQALTPRLTLNSSAEEIREKMLSSSFNWQTLELEANTTDSSLNPDNSVAYTVTHHVHTWIDQAALRYRNEEDQPGLEIIPELGISDGTISVIRDGETVIEGYPRIHGSTMVWPVAPSVSLDESLGLMENGEALFPPMGEVFSGHLNTQIFPSAYAVQNPGVYQPQSLETVAGRECLKVFYEDADRWGRIDDSFTLWIDTETGMILKAVTDGTPNHYTSEIEVTRIVYNPHLDERLFNTEEAMPDLNLPALQAQTVNEITMYAGDLHVDEGKLIGRFCFELPSTADWMLYDIRHNGGSAAGLEMRLLYLEQAGTLHAKGLRCDTMLFPESVPAGPLHLEIGKMQAPPREGTYCDEAAAVQMELDENESGIRFTCIEEHGTLIQIDEKPQDMTDEEAQYTVFTMMQARNTPIIEGPWVFDLVLEE